MIKLLILLLLTGCAWLRPVERDQIVYPPVTWEEMQEVEEETEEEEKL